MFFELCDEENEGYINEDKLMKFLKLNLKSKHEKSIIKDSGMIHKTLINKFIWILSSTNRFE